MKKAYIFGAGKDGSAVLKHVKKLKQYETVLFCDNDVNKVGRQVEECLITDYRHLMEDACIGGADVYIAASSGGAHSIYEQCRKDGIAVKGFYSRQQDDIVKYKEWCREARVLYGNERFWEYKRDKEKRVLEGICKLDKGEPLSGCITEVAIELSNLCNYANIHKQCPVSLENDKKIMPLQGIQNIISQLAELKFKGMICFHIYNEPLIDPRLFYIIQNVKEKLKDVKILVYTNGFYLNQVMARDLQDGFADIVTATGYGRQEWERLIDLEFDIPYGVLYGNLDKRLEMENCAVKTCKVPCSSLISQVPIFVNGDIGLCCLDYKHMNGFGNVFQNSIKEILDDSRTTRIQKGLLQGDRTITQYCAKCDWEGFPCK